LIVLGLVREDARIFYSFNKYFELAKATRPNVPVILWCPEEETYTQAMPKAMEWGIPISQEKNLSLQSILKPIIFHDRDQSPLPSKMSSIPYWVHIVFAVLVALLVFQKFNCNTLMGEMEESHKLEIKNIMNTNSQLQSAYEVLRNKIDTLESGFQFDENTYLALQKDKFKCQATLNSTEIQLQETSEKLAGATETIAKITADTTTTILKINASATQKINELKGDHLAELAGCNNSRTVEKNKCTSQVAKLESQLLDATQQLETATKNITDQKNEAVNKDPELRKCYYQIESQKNEIEDQELKLRRCQEQLKH